MTTPALPRPRLGETIAALSSLDTCTVANAIESFDVRLHNEGFTDASIRCQLPDLPPMVGFAATLRVRSSSPSWKGDGYLDRTDWWAQLQEQTGPHILVIQDVDKQPGAGAFVGEVHAAILQALGSIGAVTNGSVRDLPDIRRLGFRLFAATVAVSHAYMHVVDFGAPVEIGGLRIAPGDLLHGDLHGIVSIPLAIAERVPEAAFGIRERDRRIVKACGSPGLDIEALRKIAAGNLRPSGEGSRGTENAN